MRNEEWWCGAQLIERRYFIMVISAVAGRVTSLKLKSRFVADLHANG